MELCSFKVGCSRGLVIGNLRLFNSQNQTIDFGNTPVSLFEHLKNYEYVHTNAKFVLIVEKDSIFQRLMDEEFTKQFPEAILVTGRGYPDFCTINFLHFLSKHAHLKFFALMDADPHGEF